MTALSPVSSETFSKLRPPSAESNPNNPALELLKLTADYPNAFGVAEEDGHTIVMARHTSLSGGLLFCEHGAFILSHQTQEGQKNPDRMIGIVTADIPHVLNELQNIPTNSTEPYIPEKSFQGSHAIETITRIDFDKPDSIPYLDMVEIIRSSEHAESGFLETSESSNQSTISTIHKKMADRYQDWGSNAAVGKIFLRESLGSAYKREFIPVIANNGSEFICSRDADTAGNILIANDAGLFVVNIDVPAPQFFESIRQEPKTLINKLSEINESDTGVSTEKDTNTNTSQITQVRDRLTKIKAVNVARALAGEEPLIPEN
ncbi:MAG: hypothetical protein WC851_03015 [Candidatus Shapirobacteria bacterium]|jgi:hypothetical protein